MLVFIVFSKAAYIAVGVGCARLGADCAGSCYAECYAHCFDAAVGASRGSLMGENRKAAIMTCSNPNATESANVTEKLKAHARELEPYVIERRRHFHAYPELSAREVSTSRTIAEELDKLGIEYVRAGGTGLIATIKGTAPDAYDEEGKPRRRIALRTDMDALPVLEQTKLPFASRNEGVMHACGHDCHMAMMLGTVHLLLGIRDQLHGEVRVLFQPAEEISVGSRKMIAEGALDGVDTIYAAHIWSEVEAGTISAEAGPRMANCDWFRIDVAGASAHGAMPHKGVDAIVVGAAVIDALQVIVSRDVSPFDPAVITIGEFHGGVARNIMAGTAYLTGTVRSFTPEVRDYIKERMAHVVEEVALSYGATAKFEWTYGNSCLVNDEACAARAQNAIAKVLGEEALCHYEGTLSGEDFTEYLAKVPGVLVFIGARNPEVGATYPQHSCFYNVDESVLVGGSLAAAQYAFDFLSEE